MVPYCLFVAHLFKLHKIMLDLELFLLMFAFLSLSSLDLTLYFVFRLLFNKLIELLHSHMCCKLCRGHSYILFRTCYSISYLWLLSCLEQKFSFLFEKLTEFPLAFRVCVCMFMFVFFPFPSFFFDCILSFMILSLCNKRKKALSQVE